MRLRKSAIAVLMIAGLAVPSPAFAATDDSTTSPPDESTSAPVPEKREVTIDGKTEVIESNLPGSSWKTRKRTN
ncbi:hypothetical protein GCM10025774_20530 [Microbacterium kyungheense]